MEPYGIITYSVEIHFGLSGFGTFKGKQLYGIPAPRNINKNAQKDTSLYLLGVSRV